MAVYKAFLCCVGMPEREGYVDFKGRQASEGLGNTTVAGQSRHVGELDSD
jgi:hypothetical protein